MPARPLVIMGFVLVMTSLGLLSASTWQADKQLASATGLVAHTLEVLTTLEQIKSHMAQAESAQRGYFLQQQPSFLHDREAALDAVWAGIVTIERLARDNPAQGERITNLRRLFVDQNAVFTEARLLQQPGQFSRQDAYFVSGELAWNALEEQTDGIRITENNLLVTRIADAASSSRTARLSFALLMGLLSVVMYLLLWHAYRDIGRQRRTDDELLLRQQAREKAEAADRSKSVFLANMSHEIRSPLNAILGLGYLLEQTRLEPDARNMVRRMMASGRTLLGTINDILDVSRIESGHLLIEQAPFRLSDVTDKLAASMRIAAGDKPLALIIGPVPDDVNTVIGDALRLEQVLLNLTGNAIKFTAAGSVTVSIELVERDGAHITLRFCVRDTGIGIAPAAQESIFLAFTQADSSTTRRFGGTGLGLTICRQLVGLMGGHIGLISTPGTGSEFWFTLPLQQTAALAAPVLPEPVVPESATGLMLDGVRLLIVDDSDINREIAQRILADQGAQVTLAVDGRAALDWLLAHPDEVDLVLMDVQMPVMDGLEATRRLRRLPQFDDLPVVALSAGAFKIQRDEASAAGMNDFVSKPFDVPAIIALVQRLQRPSRADAAVTTSAAMPMDAARGLQLWPDVLTYRDYLQRFARSYADVIERLQIQLLAADRRSAAALSHKLSGDAANLGLPELHRLGGLAERILSDGQDAAPVLQQLHTALTLTLQAIAQYAPALAAPADDPEQGSGELPESDRSGVQGLLRDLLVALDSDSPTPVEPLLAALANRLPRAALAAVRECVHEFDFRGAEAAVRLLAQQHQLQLKD
ncbi:MAG: response regulator [Oxalobacteraceae bacterium]|nr:response regulator [Oxalobacteraceae bacterium]